LYEPLWLLQSTEGLKVFFVVSVQSVTVAEMPEAGSGGHIQIQILPVDRQFQTKA
jgi:hypothetical protein